RHGPRHRYPRQVGAKAHGLSLDSRTTRSRAVVNAILRSVRGSRFIRFGIVGAAGFVVDTTVLFLLFQLSGLPYTIARGISVFMAMNFTWLGNRTLTFREHAAREPRAILGEWARFLATNAFGALVNWSVSNVLVRWAPSPANNPYVALVVGVGV